MDILPRHVVCILGRWTDFSAVKKTVKDWGRDFTFDEEYSQLKPDERMPMAFEASMDRFRLTMTDEDWEAIESHSAVAYILSPPMTTETAETVSAGMLTLTATLLHEGGLAAKSESAGLAHGRDEWTNLAESFVTAHKEEDEYSAATKLYWAWVQRIIHDSTNKLYYSVGMHLLGHPDTEVDDSLEVSEALEWMDLMGLYRFADKPDRPIFDGEGFRLQDEGPRRIIQLTPCRRYEEDEFFFNPYGYTRLVSEEDFAE